MVRLADLALDDVALGGRQNPGLEGPALGRVLRLVRNHDASSGGGEVQVLQARRVDVAQRIQRVAGVRIQRGLPWQTATRIDLVTEYLLRIREAVGVAVGQSGVGGKLLLQTIHQCIAIAVGEIVGRTVVEVVRVRAAEVLVEVGQPVPVGVGGGVIDAIEDLEPVGHTVAVAVVEAVESQGAGRAQPIRRAVCGGSIEDAVQTRVDGVGVGVLPSRVCEVFDGHTAVVKAEAPEQPGCRRGHDFPASAVDLFG